MSKYNYNLDFVKLIAIVGVVFLHISDGYLLRADYFGSGLIWFFIFFLRVLAGVSVPVFVMTSGYLTIGKKYTINKLFNRIFIRLFIPFVFLFIVTTWMTGVTAAHLHNTVLKIPLPNLYQEIGKFFTAPGPLHFLIALIGLNMLMPVWNMVFCEKEEKNGFILAKYIIIIGFIFAFTATLNLNFNPNITSGIINEWRWFLWVGYFLLGYLIRRQPKLITKKIASLLFFGGLFISLVATFAIRKFLIVDSNNSLLAGLANLCLDYQSLWVSMMSVGAWVIFLKTNFTFLKRENWKKIINIGSSLSLGVYLLHGLVLNYFDVFKRIGLDNMLFWHRPAFAVIGLTSLTLLISGIITYFLGLIPVLRMLIGNDDKWLFLKK